VKAVLPVLVQRLLILSVALVAALALCAPASARTLKAIWGPVTLPNGQSAGPVYKDLGVDSVEYALQWSGIAPTKPAQPRNPNDPAYHWPAEGDALVKLGRAKGFAVSMMLVTSPPWANGGKPAIWAPRNPKDFADFAYAAAKHYSTVRRWMIWGEPSRAPQWQPLPKNKPTAPRRYARVLDASYGQLKKANKRNLVIGGMTFTVGDVLPRHWLRWMRLPNGKPPRLDMWGHNPFSTRFPDLSDDLLGPKFYDFNDLDSLHKDVGKVYRKAYPTKFRHAGPKIWVSEFTIQADHGSQDFNFFTSLSGQGKWVAAAYREANKTDYIAGLGWLGLLDAPAAPYNNTTGLMTYELAKKPAYYAYKRAK
jgi:hypothetical protein